MNTLKNIAYLLLALLIVSSCKKDDEESTEPASDKTGSLKLMFEFKAGDETFELDKEYITANDDTISATELKMFVSNIMLMGEANFSEIDSYHLIEEMTDEMMCVFTVEEVPVGGYTMLHFGVGVDSIANHSTDHVTTGDLDPAKSEGMLWSWDTGYKFLKFEGSYKATDDTEGDFVYHAGGDANYKEVQLTNVITLEEGQTTSAHIVIDVLKIFTDIDVSTLNKAHGAGAESIMTNLSNAFMLHHTMVEEDETEAMNMSM